MKTRKAQTLGEIPGAHYGLLKRLSEQRPPRRPIHPHHPYVCPPSDRGQIILFGVLCVGMAVLFAYMIHLLKS